jgi:GT2 family glycosyltransferase
VIANETNVGFGRACNQALEHVRSPYVLLLNPDATLSLAALETLRTFMDETPAAGMAAPAICTPDGRWQYAGGTPTPLRVLMQAAGASRRFPGRTTVRPGASAFPTDWLCGAILMMRRTMLAEIGAFDPRFFLYFEDFDWSVRLNRVTKTAFVPSVEIGHHGGHAARKGLRHIRWFVRSGFRFYRRHGWKWF